MPLDRAAILAFGFAAALAVSPANAQIFPGPIQIPVAASPQGVVAIDLDGDGKLDLVTIEHSSNAVGVLHGNGNGTFAAESLYPTAPTPFSIVLGDFTGDGILDAASPSFGLGSVGLIAGNGAAGFGTVTTYPVGFQPEGIAMGDLNNDGRLDLVTSNKSGGLSILLANPSGGFLPATPVPFTTEQIDVGIGDLNNDGNADVVSLGAITFSAAVLLGDGSGGVGAPAFFSAGSYPRKLALADLDANGALDVAVADGGNLTAGSSGMTIRFGNGAGSLLAPIAIPINGKVYYLTPVDFDGNGLLDLFSAQFLTDTVAVVLQTSAGAFGAPTLYGGGYLPFSTAVADLDGDSAPDGIVGNGGSASLTLLRGNGLGGFVTQPRFSLGITPGGSVAIDIDLDGHADVVAASTTLGSVPGSVAILHGNGGGQFQLSSGPVLATGTHFLEWGDLDHDGLPDLVAVNQTANTLEIMVGIGGGALAPPVSLPTTDFPADLAIADLNLDGLLDLVTVESGFAPPPRICAYLGLGAGGFAAPATTALPNSPSSIALGDLNHDYLPDAVVGDDNGPAFVRVWLGLGSGAFVPSASYPTTSGATKDLTLAEMSGDGHLDVVVAYTNAVLVIRGDGAGGFGPASDTKATSGLDRVSVGDLDGDGFPDAAASSLGTGSLFVFLGLGGGYTVLDGTYPVFGAARRIAFADFDENGRLDAAIPISDTKDCAVLLNVLGVPTGTFSYGTGTPGCYGALATGGNISPKVGSASFAILATNAPRESLGLVLITDSQDSAGSDPFNLGILLHAGFAGATQVFGLDARSDAGGAAFTAAPIPNYPYLVGSAYFAQAIFVEANDATCGGSPFQFVSSKGLAIVIQP